MIGGQVLYVTFFSFLFKCCIIIHELYTVMGFIVAFSYVHMMCLPIFAYPHLLLSYPLPLLLIPFFFAVSPLSMLMFLFFCDVVSYIRIVLLEHGWHLTNGYITERHVFLCVHLLSAGVRGVHHRIYLLFKVCTEKLGLFLCSFEAWILLTACLLCSLTCSFYLFVLASL